MIDRQVKPTVSVQFQPEGASARLWQYLQKKMRGLALNRSAAHAALSSAVKWKDHVHQIQLLRNHWLSSIVCGFRLVDSGANGNSRERKLSSGQRLRTRFGTDHTAGD